MIHDQGNANLLEKRSEPSESLARTDTELVRHALRDVPRRTRKRSQLMTWPLPPALDSAGKGGER